MTTRNSTHRREAGFTLIEVLFSMFILLAITGATVTFLRSQNQSFLDGSRRLDALQNARFAISQVERELRTLGAGVPGQQPMLVYGNANVIAFNADYVEQDSTNFRWAVYYNPNVGDVADRAWLLGDAAVIPNTAFTYPPTTYRQANGNVSPAETHIFWLAADGSTTRSDDYILWERSNNTATEMVSRNILQIGTKPFFEFFLARRLVSGADTLILATGGLLPLIRVPLTSTMTSTDSANATRPDSVPAIRMNFRITNGLSGASERLKDVSTVVALPNNGLPSASVCGRAPFPVPAFSATQDAVAGPGSGRVVLSWTAAPDQEGGEIDVWQYTILRRVNGALIWEDPVLNLGKTVGAPSYTTTIGGNTPGTVYDFGVVAQDCTPAQSTIVVSTVTAP